MTRTPLPIQTDLADIEAFCSYLITKPDGVSPEEVISEKALDRRKLSALKFWGLIEDTGTRLRLSERGLLVARDNGANRVTVLREVVASITPYASVIARAVQNNEIIVRSEEVAAHWHQRFRPYTQSGFLNHQVVCFFRVAEAADLGRLVVGRKGHQTRFELAEGDARAFIDRADVAQQTGCLDDGPDTDETEAGDHGGLKFSVGGRGNRVFITRRMNRKIVEQMKELVEFGKFAPVVAGDRVAAKPSLHDVMDEMRGCDTAVIQVGPDGLQFDRGRSDEPRLGSDVLIEIGAAMALFGRNFILLVEGSVTLPTNLQGLCECRYSGEELDMPATMTLFKTFNDFTRSRPTRPLTLAIGTDHVVPEVMRYERIGAPAYASN